jgi:hypothetical protein
LEEYDMDPITVAIVAALATGVVSRSGEVGTKTIVDAYAVLKAVITRKVGIDSEVAKAVDALERKSDSAGRRSTLREEVEAAQLDQDPEVVRLAIALVEQVRELPGGPLIVQQATGSYNVSAGPDSTASVNVGRSELPGDDTKRPR